MDQIEQPGIRREKTAIVRFRHSKPVTLALQQGVITTETSVFDYGCGRGEDVKYLKSVGVEAAGWDPHYQPMVAPRPADVVNLGYVLNVIEDPQEREETLRKSFDFAKRVLVVAVRVDHSLDAAVEFSDGLLTSRGSFQKLYSQSEFRDYVAQVLGRRPHMAGLGVAYVFRDELVESSYLVSVAQKRVETSREQAIDQFTQDAAARKYIELTAALGRAPIAAEFSGYPELQERFGSLGRIERLARHALSIEAVEESRRRRREDILTYMAMARLRNLKAVPFRLLPQDLRADIRMLWPSYAAALREGNSFLFRIGNPELVRNACQSAPVGKKLPDALYVHHSAEEQLGALLRLIIFAARQVVGQPEYNVIKISTDGRKLSFLQYADFDDQAHPELRHSVRVLLPLASYSVRNYSASLNPPILHRKETVVDVLYPYHTVFSELSAQEAASGLLARSDIGTKQAWLALLAESKLTIIGHQLIPTSDA
ncbi:MAG TPA: DNA phosphorothioation-associated putative methyltransferase [Terriglobales bacterium]|nr:DNA phosphorothioation-associated putative methyltransferase [Terriglobales bacterium]